MVSLFPHLFDYGFLATGILRITVGIIVIYLAYQSLFVRRRERIASLEKEGMRPGSIFLFLVSGAKLLLGIFLTIGLFTQIATLIVSVFSLASLFITRQRPALLIVPRTNEFYMLLFVVSLAIAFIGPGALALDLPL